MTSTAPRRKSAVHVRRTSASDDAELSPFILEPSSVVLGQKRSMNHYEGTFLKTPVSIRTTKTRLSALRLMHYMEGLRHPNLEQLLGVVVDKSAPQSMLVTSQVTGMTVADILLQSERNNSTIGKEVVSAIGVQASRALLFLHSSTSRAHPGLCPHGIVFDEHRNKAVILLALRCRECRTDLRVSSIGGDLEVLAKIILNMAECEVNTRSKQCPLPNSVMKLLKNCTQAEYQDKVNMKKLCHVLSTKI